MSTELLSTDGTPPGETGDSGSVAHTTETLSPVRGFRNQPGISCFEETLDGKSIAVAWVIRSMAPGVSDTLRIERIGDTPQKARQSVTEAWNDLFDGSESARLRSERDQFETLYNKAAQMCEVSTEMLALIARSDAGITLTSSDHARFEELRAHGERLADELDALDPDHPSALDPVSSTPRVERDSPETPDAAA